MVDDFEHHLPTPKTNMEPENASLEKENASTQTTCFKHHGRTRLAEACL